jgi:hypothetical protein
MKILLLCLLSLGLAGCAKPIQRFVPVVVPAYHDDAIGEVSPDVMVLDTQTGQWCKGSPKQASLFPLCHDLYIGKIK